MIREDEGRGYIILKKRKTGWARIKNEIQEGGDGPEGRSTK